MISKRAPLSRFVPARRIHVAAVALFAALVLLLGHPPAQAAPTSPAVAPMVSPPTNQIIVQFAPAGEAALLSANTGQLLDRLSTAAGLTVTLERPMSGNAYVVGLPARIDEAAVAAMAARMAALPEVVYAEPDAIMQIIASPPLAEAPAANLTPDDTRFADQWHYRYVPGVEEGLNLLPAWGITTGSAATVVAVIDTGIRGHADLAGRTVPGYDFIADAPTANDGNGRDNDPTDPGDWSTAGQCFPGSTARDSSWHGTHVAGTIGAASNNGSDVAGVNWKAKILPLRVLGRCGGFLSDIVDATRWAAGLAVPGAPANANPADVINLSLGGSGACGASYQNAFNDLAAAGVVSVVAAGNSAINAANARPANCNNVITVAATSKTGDQTYYTNFGALVEIAAPGGEQFAPNDAGGVLSTLNAGLTGPGADDLRYYQGTSMASPHVAGLVSLLLGEDPSLTPAEVLDILQTTARPFPAGSSCDTSTCGAGIADAFAALSALNPGLSAPLLITPTNGQTLATAEVAFEWGGVENATGYRLQVATDSDFNDLVVNDASLLNTSATKTLPGEGTYYWRVRALGDEDGPWSEVWSFTIAFPACTVPDAPMLSDPADGSSVGDLTPNFQWGAVMDATTYDIRVSKQPDVSNPIISDSSATAGYTVTTSLTDNETYYWRVRAHNNGGACNETGPWSEVWQFSIAVSTCPTPAIPELLFPEDASTVNAAPTLTWADATDATEYEVRIGIEPDVADTLKQATVTDTEYAIDLTLTDGTTYYWMVRAGNSDGSCNTLGDWSAVWSFTYEKPQPVTYLAYLPAVFGQ
ncbi:MAG TPA: S8 family serine peptidase [Promineifilum sp.]|nr:S8 family serine peptidase [Promineifilum sp.]